MGYRSDVAYTIRFNEPEHMALFIAEALSKDYGKPALAECMVDHKKLQINFNAESVKWYESYPDVKCHDDLVSQAKDWCDTDDHLINLEGGASGTDHYKLGYIFIRIGENSDDVQEDFGGEYDWDWMRVSRQIVTDWSDWV